MRIVMYKSYVIIILTIKAVIFADEVILVWSLYSALEINLIGEWKLNLMHVVGRHKSLSRLIGIIK